MTSFVIHNFREIFPGQKQCVGGFFNRGLYSTESALLRVFNQDHVFLVLLNLSAAIETVDHKSCCQGSKTRWGLLAPLSPGLSHT